MKKHQPKLIRCLGGLAAALFIGTIPVNEAMADGETVEIAIYSEDNLGKVYLAWTPVQAWARLTTPSQNALQIQLTNDEGSDILTPSGKRIDGDLAFSLTRPGPGETVTESAISLTLPADGSSVPFYLAGDFPQASTEDEDAVILVKNTNNVVIDQRKTMVRIRKEFKTLTEGELDRFFEALVAFHSAEPNTTETDGYLDMMEIHNWAARGKTPGLPFPPYPGEPYQYPDQAHQGGRNKNPGGFAFLPWHRAFLLQFERSLQEISPSVSLPYWPVNVKNDIVQVFTLSGMGMNNGPVGETVVPDFEPGHPLELWMMPRDNPSASWQPIQRFGGTTLEQGFPAQLDDILLGDNNRSFEQFAGGIESNPHNLPGHNNTGPWMGNCRTSPRDPIFWVFHSWFDNMWARWQVKYERFDQNSSDAYFPSGEYPGDADAINAIGHYQKDQMWPWNGVVGSAADGPVSSRRPPVALNGPFKPSGVAGIWPSTEAMPTPGEMVDYLGILGDENMGYGYDNLDFIPTPESATIVRASAQSSDHRATVFANSSASFSERLNAAAGLDVRNHPRSKEVVQKLAVDPSASDQLRMIGLGLLANAEMPGLIALAAKILKDDKNGGERLDAHVVGLLNAAQMFHPVSNKEKMVAMKAIEGAMHDKRKSVAAAAIVAMASMQSPEAAALLRSKLNRNEALPVSLDSAILLLWEAAGEKSHDDLRRFLGHHDDEVRSNAAAVLGGDEQSQKTLRALLRDPKQPYKVHLSAARSLLHNDDTFAALALELISNDETPRNQRDLLIRALDYHSSGFNPTGLPQGQLDSIRAKVSQMKAS